MRLLVLLRAQLYVRVARGNEVLRRVNRPPVDLRHEARRGDNQSAQRATVPKEAKSKHRARVFLKKDGRFRG